MSTGKPGGGTVIGENNATYTKVSSFSGGSSSYSGGENWTWSDPNLSTYDASALADIRITPNDPPGVGPVTFRSEPNVVFVKPPAMVEDPEATAAAENEESAVANFIWGLIPGISLVDAWEEYKKGNYASAALNALFGAADLASAGAMMKVKGGGKFVLAYLKSWIQDAVVDAVSSAAGNAVAERLGPEAEIATQMFEQRAFGCGIMTRKKIVLEIRSIDSSEVDNLWAWLPQSIFGEKLSNIE